jgi:hypothetical protein
MHATTIRRPVVAASALLFAAAVAFAGAGHAGGPRGGHGGHGGPAGGPPGAMVEHVIAQLKDKLALDSSQQQMFEQARAQTLAARDQALGQRGDVRARIDAELAKAEPDLAAVAAAFEGAEDQARAARRQVRDQWLKLYANLRADQKAVVRDAIRDRLARADAARERMKERRQSRAHG